MVVPPDDEAVPDEADDPDDPDELPDRVAVDPLDVDRLAGVDVDGDATSPVAGVCSITEIESSGRVGVIERALSTGDLSAFVQADAAAMAQAANKMLSFIGNPIGKIL